MRRRIPSDWIWYWKWFWLEFLYSEEEEEGNEEYLHEFVFTNKQFKKSWSKFYWFLFHLADSGFVKYGFIFQRSLFFIAMYLVFKSNENRKFQLKNLSIWKCWLNEKVKICIGDCVVVFYMSAYLWFYLLFDSFCTWTWKLEV